MNNYPRGQATKDKIEKFNYIKIKTHVHQDYQQDWKGNTQNQRQYSQIIYLIRGNLQKYEKKSYKSNEKQQVFSSEPAATAATGKLLETQVSNPTSDLLNLRTEF